MATKRRKVWVTFKGEKQKEPAALNATAADAADISKWYGTRAVPMVERLPGDVVLSREEVATRKHVAERLESWLKGMKMESLDECDHIRQPCGDVGCTRPLTEAIALLRGRR